MLFNNMLLVSGQSGAIELVGEAVGDVYGHHSHFSADDGRLAVVARNKGTGGSVYVYTMNGATATQEQRIDGPSTTGDIYVAKLDSTGTRLVAGAFTADERASNGGAAYVYARSGSTWSLEATLAPASNTANDFFGYDVGISANGDVIAVSHGGDDAGGGATVFTRSGTTWTRRTQLLPTGVDSSTDAGARTCDVSPDGGTVAFGVLRDSQSGTDSGGTVFVYKGAAASWTLSQKLYASDRGTDDEFGTHVRFGGNLTLIAGANEYDVVYGANTRFNTGAVYVFDRTSTSASFTETAILTPDFDPNTNGFSHGLYTAISGDGANVLSGVISYDADGTGGSTAQGHASLWQKTNGTWVHSRVYAPPPSATGTFRFGYYPALNSDGSVLVIGAEEDSAGTTAGAIYIFT